MNESTQFLKHYDIVYSVSLMPLRFLNKNKLMSWERTYFLNIWDYEYSLDALYMIMCSDEVKCTKIVRGTRR